MVRPRFGPYDRLDRRLGGHLRRRARNGEPRQIAGIYPFLFFGVDGAAASAFWVGVAGVIWILLMSWICYIGVELSARTQYSLLAAEILALGALRGRRADQGLYRRPVRVGPPLARLAEPVRHLVVRRAYLGALLAIFLLGLGHGRLGERGDRGRHGTPGRRPSEHVLLLGIYLVVSIAAQAYHGVGFLNNNRTTYSARSARTSSGPRGQDPDHRRPDLGVGVDSNDDLPATRQSLSMAAHGASRNTSPASTSSTSRPASRRSGCA